MLKLRTLHGWPSVVRLKFGPYVGIPHQIIHHETFGWLQSRKRWGIHFQKKWEMLVHLYCQPHCRFLHDNLYPYRTASCTIFLSTSGSGVSGLIAHRNFLEIKQKSWFKRKEHSRAARSKVGRNCYAVIHHILCETIIIMSKRPQWQRRLIQPRMVVPDTMVGKRGGWNAKTQIGQVTLSTLARLMKN